MKRPVTLSIVSYLLILIEFSYSQGNCRRSLLPKCKGDLDKARTSVNLVRAELSRCEKRVVELTTVEEPEDPSGLPVLDEDEQVLAERIRGLRGSLSGGLSKDVTAVSSKELVQAANIRITGRRTDRSGIDLTECRIDCDGSMCTCPKGYKRAIGLGNAVACQDIDECRGRRNPCAADEICFNTNGGYQCEKQQCDDGYTPSVQGDVLLCSRNVQCTGDFNCIFSTYTIFHAMPARIKNLPFQMFSSNIRGTRGRLPSEALLDVDCLKCGKVIRKATAGDFRVTLPDEKGIASNIELLNELEGPQELLVTVTVKVKFTETQGFTFKTQLKVVVGACDF